MKLYIITYEDLKEVNPIDRGGVFKVYRDKDKALQSFLNLLGNYGKQELSWVSVESGGVKEYNYYSTCDDEILYKLEVMEIK